jgi:hypothetical protein
VPDGMVERMIAAKDQVELPNLLFEMSWENPASDPGALSNPSR